MAKNKWKGKTCARPWGTRCKRYMARDTGDTGDERLKTRHYNFPNNLLNYKFQHKTDKNFALRMMSEKAFVLYPAIMGSPTERVYGKGISSSRKRQNIRNVISLSHCVLWRIYYLVIIYIIIFLISDYIPFLYSHISFNWDTLSNSMFNLVFTLLSRLTTGYLLVHYISYPFFTLSPFPFPSSSSATHSVHSANLIKTFCALLQM